MHPILIFALLSVAFVLTPWIIAFSILGLHDLIKYRLLGMEPAPDTGWI